MTLGLSLQEARAGARALLQNVLASQAAYSPYEQAYASHATSDALRGLAGFVLLMRDLEMASRTTAQQQPRHSRDARIHAATRYLGDPLVQAELAETYGIPGIYDLSEASIYRLGTTSVILECPRLASDDNVALKCVLYRYSSVDAIKTHTAGYRQRYDAGHQVSFMPKVFDCGELFIAMELIRGKTLAEHLAERRTELTRSDVRRRPQPTEVVKAQLGFAAAIGQKLSETLAVLAKTRARNGEIGIHHLDLSPTNILIREPFAVGTVPSIVLVDFGVNYLITEDLGTTAAIMAASDYIAQECYDVGFQPRRSRAGELADAYSLALVVLHCAALENPRSGREHAMDALWRTGPGHARVLEDLLDDAPERRAVAFRYDPAEGGDSGKRGELFGWLARTFQDEADVQAAFYDVQDGGDWGRLGRVARQWVVNRATVAAMFTVAAKWRDDPRPAYRAFYALGCAAAVCSALWLLVLIGFVTFTLLVPGPGLQGNIADALMNIVQSNSTAQGPYDASDYLPGRIAAVGLGTLAFTAYMNIYATMDFSRLPLTDPPRGLHWKVLGARFFVRMLIVVPFIPMLWVVWVSPRYWAVLCGPGMVWAALANTFTYFVWVEGADRARALFSRDPDIDNRFRDQFKWWAGGMAIYALALMAFGVWYELGNIQDALPYAIIIAIFTTVQVSFGRCVAQGPQIRGRLLRGMFDLRRSLLLAEQQPAGGAPPPTLREWIRGWHQYWRRGG
jgi:serine/threonine protein kinase